MKRISTFFFALVTLVPSLVYIYEAKAATLLVTIDPNTYSGSGNITDSTSGIVGTPSNVSYLSSTNCGVFSFAANGSIAFPQTNFGTQFSISAWVKPNSGSNIQTLMSNAGANLNTNGFKVYWNTWSTNDLKMLVENGNGSVGNSTISSSAVVTNSEWQHLVYTFNTSTNVITMYRNGTLVGHNGNALVSAPSPGTNQTWWLGAIGGSSYYMNAQLGIVKIYSTVLTSGEVTTDYNSTSARYAATPSCPVPAAPTNSVAPSISGTTAYAGVLTAANGSWSANPTGYTYQWQSSTTSNGTYSNISGATSQTYTLTSADIGNYLKVNVTASNAGGSNTATSAASAQISKAAQSTLSASLSVTSKTYPYSQSLTITPSGGTGTGATTYAITAGGTASGCALSNATSTPTITASSYGTCLIAATKASDANYLSATSANLIFTFNRATPTSLTITSTSGTYLQTLTLTTSGGQSSASDTFSVTSGPCSVTGSSLSSSAYGTCYVTAYRAADSNYSATSSVSTAITIFKATPTLSYSVSTPPVYRQQSNISVTSSTAGSFKFLINDKVIPGCQSKVANAGNGYVATCAWKPAARNYVALSMGFTPADTSYFNGKIVGPTYLVAARAGLR